MLEMLQTNFYKPKGSGQDIHIAILSVLLQFNDGRAL